jgi:hypothetical protein
MNSPVSGHIAVSGRLPKRELGYQLNFPARADRDIRSSRKQPNGSIHKASFLFTNYHALYQLSCATRWTRALRGEAFCPPRALLDFLSRLSKLHTSGRRRTDVGDRKPKILIPNWEIGSFCKKRAFAIFD